MSWQAMEAVQDHSELSNHIALCIMYALARSADENGVVGAGGRYTAPNVDTIAGRAHCHRNTVLNWLPKLEESGELRVERFGEGRGAWNRYTILLPMPEPEEAQEDEEEQEPDRLDRLEEMVQMLAKTVQDNHRAVMETVQETVQNGTSHDGLDTKDTKEPPPSPPPYDGPEWRLPADFDEESFGELWLDWVLHRHDIEEPLTQKQGEYQLRRLEKMGQSRAVAALKHSIAGGWKNIYEPDRHNGTGKSEHAEEVIDESGGYNI